LQHQEAAAIAVVDPDEQARAAAAALCESAGYRVLPFASGAEFLGAGPPEQVACIVLDISTPDRQGIDVLRRLAERAAAPPVIVLTGKADIGLVVEAMKLRAIDLNGRRMRSTSSRAIAARWRSSAATSPAMSPESRAHLRAI
jgi:FixJ family two-component response regulator